jgi:hypothetical protein
MKQMKQHTGGFLEQDDDDWETLSVKSGASSDDEDYLLLKFQSGNEMPAFDRKYNIDDESSSQEVDDIASLNDKHQGVVDAQNDV